MSHYSWRKDLLTVPNFLSIFRLLLIPVYIRMYCSAVTPLDHYLAGSVLGLSCLTDLADGKIARKYKMISNAGKLLDPLADKLTQLALIVSLSGVHRILYPVLILFLIKESFQTVTMLLFLQKGKVLPGALYSGKLCTTVLFVSLTVLVLFPNLSPSLVTVFVLADGMFLLYSFACYIQAYFGTANKLTDFQSE